MQDELNTGNFPQTRMRRRRRSEAVRRLVRETRFSLDQLVMPYFVKEGTGVREKIDAMPGQFRFSTDTLLAELESLVELGIRSILLFGISSRKDLKAGGAADREGVIPHAVRQIKKNFPDLLVMTDVCLCAYTSHGHCGLINQSGEIDNDASLEVIKHMAAAHAEAGADGVAPSDMMDGRVAAIRKELDRKGYSETFIMSYSAKYASAFYGPFRDAAYSEPRAVSLGADGNVLLPEDRKSYQMDPSNIKEAMTEIALDIREGADIVMIKPAWSYLDVIREAARRFDVPLAAYSVSGEYSMIKAAAEKGWLDERRAVEELVTSLVRAGANILISYHAKQIALWRNELQLMRYPRVASIL